MFNPATLSYLFQERTWMFNVIWHGFFHVQWFEVRGGYLFCLYWRNCWTSLFKHSFHHPGDFFGHGGGR
jgi:hypothetical protein